MVRDRRRAGDLERTGLRGAREGNVLQPWSLQGAGTGVDVAYYLVHSMGRGRQGRLPLAGSRGRRRVCPDGAPRGHRSRRLPGRARRQAALRSPAQPPRDGRDAGARGTTAHIPAGRDGGGRGQRVVQDAALSRGAAARDDRARLAVDRDAADRGRRRPLLYGAGAGRARVRPGGRSRLAGRTCSPTATCWTAWPTCWAAGAGRRCRCRSSRRGCRRFGSGW